MDMHHALPQNADHDCEVGFSHACKHMFFQTVGREPLVHTSRKPGLALSHTCRKQGVLEDEAFPLERSENSSVQRLMLRGIST